MTRALALLAGVVLLTGSTGRRPGPGAGRTVRAGGPDQMRDPPLDWTETDERADESFLPAIRPETTSAGRPGRTYRQICP